jgi:thioredoxin
VGVAKLPSFANSKDEFKGVAVVKFFAEWCGPCKLYAPVFERVESLNPEANFYAVDIDKNPSIRDEFGVYSIPTTLILKEGVEFKRLAGAHSTRGVDNFVKGVLN